MSGNSIKNIAVIGLGNFGGFVAGVLAKDKQLTLLGHDPCAKTVPEGVRAVSLAEAAKADAAILCVPLSAYAEVLPSLRPLLQAKTLVVDICSVKVEAEKRLRQHLAGHPNLLITHPMFGPLSAANGVAGHTLVVTNASGQKAEVAVDYCEKTLGLKIMHMTNEDHDRIMADVHALTFFVARGLARTGLEESQFQAPSFQMLLDLVTFNSAHTEDLFRTIELGNPFAKQSRERLLKAFNDVNNKLERERL